MNAEEIYEEVMGHEPVTDGVEGSFGWNDIKALIEFAQTKQVVKDSLTTKKQIR